MCDLAAKLPMLIGGLLDRESYLKRGRFREETMTDVFTGALAAFAGPNLVIQYPVEKETGGDLDLCFWHVKSRTSLCVRIQAKRLNGEYNGSKAVKAKHRAYNELLHKPPTAIDYQFRVLRDAPDPWIPLYMFYNHRSVTLDPEFSGATPTVRGINLAFASDIAHELEDKLGSAAATPKIIKHHKRLSYLRKHFFGIEALLCPLGNCGGEIVPSPQLVQASLRNQYRWDGTVARGKDDVDRVIRRILEPSSLRISSVERRLSDGPSIRFSQHEVEVPTITFISGRTRDDRTPKIIDETDQYRG
ncbi:hypothetical protein CQ062_24100 [Ochrobactrum sp. MYb68]|nr:hypothetical protein CQ062_24100 [Ochrobactrum sp. MYb68]